MHIITISREFGSGGRELGKRLADLLECDYYDSEIITAVACESGLDPHYVEKKLGDHGWQNLPITFRSTLGSAAYMQSSQVQLLLEQKGKVVSRQALMTRLWESDAFIGENTLTVNVARLRKKLESAGLTDFIRTRKGAGYLVEG